MSNSGFDAQAFYSALDSERKARDCTWRQVANEARVSASTLTRMGQGKKPDLDSLGALAVWSGLNLDNYVVGKQQKQKSETLNEMAALLRADRNLTADGAAALEAIVKSAYQHLRKLHDEA